MEGQPPDEGNKSSSKAWVDNGFMQWEPSQSPDQLFPRLLDPGEAAAAARPPLRIPVCLPDQNQQVTIYGATKDHPATLLIDPVSGAEICLPEQFHSWSGPRTNFPPHLQIAQPCYVLPVVPLHPPHVGPRTVPGNVINLPIQKQAHYRNYPAPEAAVVHPELGNAQIQYFSNQIPTVRSTAWPEFGQVRSYNPRLFHGSNNVRRSLCFENLPLYQFSPPITASPHPFAGTYPEAVTGTPSTYSDLRVFSRHFRPIEAPQVNPASRICRMTAPRPIFPTAAASLMIEAPRQHTDSPLPSWSRVCFKPLSASSIKAMPTPLVPPGVNHHLLPTLPSAPSSRRLKDVVESGQLSQMSVEDIGQPLETSLNVSTTNLHHAQADQASPTTETVNPSFVSETGFKTPAETSRLKHVSGARPKTLKPVIVPSADTGQLGGTLQHLSSQNNQLFVETSDGRFQRNNSGANVSVETPLPSTSEHVARLKEGGTVAGPPRISGTRSGLFLSESSDQVQPGPNLQADSLAWSFPPPNSNASGSLGSSPTTISFKPVRPRPELTSTGDNPALYHQRLTSYHSGQDAHHESGSGSEVTRSVSDFQSRTKGRPQARMKKKMHPTNLAPTCIVPVNDRQ